MLEGSHSFTGHPHIYPQMEWTILPLLCKHSPGGTAYVRWHTSDYSLLLIYRPRKDERSSWPCWLTYSRKFTHISGHTSVTGLAQDRESLPVKDWRSAMQPTNDGLTDCVCVCVRCSAQTTITHLKKFISLKLFETLDRFREVIRVCHSFLVIIGFIIVIIIVIVTASTRW